MKKIFGTIAALAVLLVMTVRADEPAGVPSAPALTTTQQEQELVKNIEKSSEACNPKAGIKQETINAVTNDKVFAFLPNPDGTYDIIYVWNAPALVETMTAEIDQNVYPGRPLCVVDIHGIESKNGKGEVTDDTRRSKAHLTAAVAFKVISVNDTVKRGEDRWIMPGTTLYTVRPVTLLHDSVQASDNKDMEFKSMLVRLWQSTGIYSFMQETSNHWSLGLGRFIMIIVGLVLLFLAIVKGFEPLLLVPTTSSSPLPARTAQSLSGTNPCVLSHIFPAIPVLSTSSVSVTLSSSPSDQAPLVP